MSIVRRFIQYYRRHWKIFALDMLCALLMAVCDLFYPMITREIINVYIPDNNLRLIVVWAVALVVIYLVKAALNYFVLYYGHVMGVDMQADMRRDVFARLQRLPFSYFDANKTGTIMSRIVNDLMDVTELAHHGPEDLFLSAAMLVGSFIMLAGINLPLTLIIFVFLPFLVIFSVKMRKRLNNAFMKTREEVGEINARLENSISGIRVAKAFNNNDYEEERFEERNRAFVSARRRAYKVMGEFHSVNTLILDFLNVVVLVAGGIFCYNGTITFGDLTAYLLFVNLFLSPIKRLIAFIEQYQNGMTGFHRFTELMDAAQEEDTPGAKDIEHVRGQVDFKNVSFSYGEGKNVLNDITLHVQPGKTIAFVGPSGGGKTTLCHLLPRFYETTGGVIEIDGVDIRDFTLRSLRENIGIVQQEVFLFTGTVYENIAYGDTVATRAAVEDAARRAEIHDFIMTLPEGYDTYIGERGIKLSGGQKQRLSIARIFLKNPPILVLDEATSALDNVTEGMIQRSLEALSHGRTTFVVAHRLSTVRRADEIIVLTDRGIEERGAHEQLLAKDGIYAGLYGVQFRDIAPNAQQSVKHA